MDGWESILKEFIIYVYPREGINAQALRSKYISGTRHSPAARLLTISSTFIRKGWHRVSMNGLLSDLQVMKIYRTKDIRTVNRLYMEKTGVSQTQLIERAALAFVRAFIREEKKPARALVVAGPGNNGADARSVARLLTEQGWQTDLWDFSDKDSLERQQADWASYLENLSTGVVVVDGLFGSGLTRPVTGFYSQIIEGINFLDTRVYAVDIPSGLPGDGIPFTGGAVVKASAFYFQFPKLSFFC